jgi:hypothetical protein
MTAICGDGRVTDKKSLFTKTPLNPKPRTEADNADTARSKSYLTN